MTNLILDLIRWAGLHPDAAGLLVAAIACAESLAFVGLVVPGAVMMLGAGALVGVGALPFWSTFLWAVGGAIVGDGVSYWLGHRYQDRFLRVRFVRNHPELLARGETFFARHGGKSILLARFVGPVRPIVPVVAGMVGMPPWRFYLFNVLSALTWAPAHLIPGMAFGASLALAGQVAGRLALGLGAVIVFVWAVVWGARAAYRQLAPHAGAWATMILEWAGRHPRLAWLVGDLIDPARPVSRALMTWLVALVAATWLFFGVLEDVLGLDPLVYAGQSLYHLLQGVRTPSGDLFMAALTEMGDAQVVGTVSAGVLLWLLWRRAWRDVRYWIAALAFGVFAVIALKLALGIPRPVDLYAGAEAYSFPSSHATLSTVIYGFLAVLSAGALTPQRRWIPYALAALLVGGIAFSRLYLGAHWLADVVAGVALGVAWVALLAIARARHGGHESIRRLPWVAVTVFLLAATWHVQDRLASDLARYAPRVPVRQMAEQVWWNAGWQTLPAYRLDLQGDTEQPINIQWAGDLRMLRQDLASRGWRPPVELSLRTAPRWLSPRPSLAELPVVPQWHDGRSEALVLVHPGESRTRHDERLILRLWPADAIIGADMPVWIGTIAWQRIERLPLVSFPRDTGGYDEALRRLDAVPTTTHWRIVRRRPGTSEEAGDEGVNWSGETLLAVTGP